MKRRLAAILFRQLDTVRELQKQTEKEMLTEARQHEAFGTLTTCPGMGNIRVAQMLPIVVTPYRFANKKSFWAYAGMAIVMRSSSDWARTPDGVWVRAKVQQTRGLNRNYNHKLKDIFKGAATTVIGLGRREDPLFQHYQRLLDGGTKPNLAKLTTARQIASIALSMWRSQEDYDAKKLTTT